MSTLPNIDRPHKESRPVLWLITGIVAAILLGFVLGQFPPRLRLIGLFAIGQGSAAGIGLAAISRHWAVRSRRLVAVCGVILGSVSFLATSCVWWHGYAHDMRQAYAVSSPALLAMQLQSSAQTQITSPLPPQEVVADALSARNKELDARVSGTGYLAFRLFGPLPSETIARRKWIAWAVWSTELIAASAMTALIAGRSLAPSLAATHENQAIQ